MGFGGADHPGRSRAGGSGGGSARRTALSSGGRAAIGAGSRSRAPLLYRCGGALGGARLALGRALDRRGLRSGGLGPGGRSLFGVSVPAPVGRLVLADTVARDLAADAIRLGILDAGGMALDANAHVVAQIYCALVRQPQLFGEFINSNPLCQLLLLPSQQHVSMTDKMPPRTLPAAYWRSGGVCGRESASTILHGLLLSPSSEAL